MFEKVVDKKTKENLALLAKSSLLKNFYLAGGTALALQFGHRKSLDLDFFSQNKFNPSLLSSQLAKLGDFSLESKTPGTLHGIFRKTRVTFLYYPYQLTFPTKKFLGAKLADFLDIGCMKLDSVSSHGAKKDFIDLYFICQRIDLQNLFEVFAKKYKNINFNLLHVLKSLIYFEDAEKDPRPKMLKKCIWLEVKKFFQQKIKKINLNWNR